MRLKNASDGPLLSVHNGNESVLANHRSYNISNARTTDGYDEGTTTTTDGGRRDQDTLQWCNAINTIQNENHDNFKNQQELQVQNKGRNQQHSLFNINNNLATSLRVPPPMRGTASSLCSESSPDDSLLDFEDAQQSCSSVDTSPQDEDRGFDLSDSESLSDDGNLSGDNTRTRGIVNPNYPGFQHLAHTLEYSIKVCSDTEFTDDDLDTDPINIKITDANNVNNNNNNNNEEDLEYKIDSVNRLDSVENIQKVFYDKPKLNIPLELLERDPEKRNNCLDVEEASSSNLGSDLEDLEGNVLLHDSSDPESIPDDVKLNIVQSVSCRNIIGDLGKEIEQELGRIANRAIEQNLEEAVEKLSVSSDLSPSALKYNIEPNTEEPFEKASAVKIETVQLLKPVTVKQKVEDYLGSVEKEVFEPINIKQSVEDLQQKRVTFYQEIDYIDPVYVEPTPEEETVDRVEDIEKILHPVSVILDVAQYPETVNLKQDSDDSSSEENDIKLQQEQEPNMVLNKQLPITQENDSNMVGLNVNLESMKHKTVDAVLSEIKDMIQDKEEQMEYETVMDNDVKMEEDTNKIVNVYPEKKDRNLDKYNKEEKTKNEEEKDEDSMVVPRKKEKMEVNYVKKRKNPNQMTGSLVSIPRRELGGRNRENIGNRRSLPAAREKKRQSPEILGSFDVYNIETAMPKIDLDAIELHLRAAREEERRRRTDREEIRRRLAMGSDDDYYTGCDRPGRKPSLQARLQSGMNLQICFMNETASDTESPSSDTECSMTEPKPNSLPNKAQTKTQQTHQRNQSLPSRPVSLPLGAPQPLLQPFSQPMTEADFFARQARLQTEARMALAQAKEMAHMQMEIERQRQKKSPITEMVRSSLEKVGIPFPEERRRVSRQILTEMNIAQLQVIVNDLHTQIEMLNENLVRYLMNRDDLHMEQDSMLVDIEDLTRYLGAKEQTVKEQKLLSQNNNIPPPSPAPASPLLVINNSVKPHLHRIASLVKK